jgi:hypothetical protein
MKTLLRLLSLGLFLLPPLPAAHAQVSVSPISDQTVNSGSTLTLNVVAADPDGGSITLAASAPAFATLNEPKAGTGLVATTMTLAPADADIGSHAASVTATSGETSDTENFQVTVAAATSNQPPRVTAPATATVAEAALLEFVVTASDADADAITSLTATNVPDGAAFAADPGFASGTFSWTPGLKQAGHYDVIFAAANALSDSATTHITVQQSDLGPVSIAPIEDVTLAEGETRTVAVTATDPDEETIQLTASLPAFATLDAPLESFGTDTLATTITIAPGGGTAGTYEASVTATSGGDSATEPFSITVTGVALEATASLIGSFNEHKKFICFKVWPVEESFDLLDVDLSTVMLSFGGESIPATRPTHLAYDCEEDCEEDCDGDGDGYGDGMNGDPEDCEPSHVMACFDMDAIQTLFDGMPLPVSLADATIEGALTGGETFVATIGGKHVMREPKHDEGKGNDELSLRIHPNPMNPKVDISFTLLQPARVRVAIYDLAGRLLTTVRAGDFAAGAYTIPWEGSTRSNGRVASGVYFVSVEADQVREVRRVTVLK